MSDSFVVVDLTSLSAYLGPEVVGQWDDASLSSALSAECAAQARVCRIPVDDAEDFTYPADLAEAVFRRVGHNLALRRLPLGVQATVSEYNATTTRVGGEDAEVRRLERPWRRWPIG